jgi:flagellar protein FliO/FliZ
MSGAEPTPTGVRSPDTVIFPQNRVERPEGVGPRPSASHSWAWLGGALLLAGGGVALILKRRGSVTPPGAKGRRLAIEETRSLGNRQYLVVAGYDRKRFLLGVTQGQIQLLAPLDDAAEEP